MKQDQTKSTLQGETQSSTSVLFSPPFINFMWVCMPSYKVSTQQYISNFLWYWGRVIWTVSLPLIGQTQASLATSMPPLLVHTSGSMPDFVATNKTNLQTFPNTLSCGCIAVMQRVEDILQLVSPTVTHSSAWNQGPNQHDAEEAIASLLF